MPAAEAPQTWYSGLAPVLHSFPVFSWPPVFRQNAWTDRAGFRRTGFSSAYPKLLQRNSIVDKNKSTWFSLQVCLKLYT